MHTKVPARHSLNYELYEKIVLLGVDECRTKRLDGLHRIHDSSKLRFWEEWLASLLAPVKSCHRKPYAVC